LDPDYIFANWLELPAGNGAQSAINGGFPRPRKSSPKRGFLPVLKRSSGRIYDLSFDAGYRYFQVHLGPSIPTRIKFGVEYAPIKDVKLRAGYKPRSASAKRGRFVSSPSGRHRRPAGTADPCWGPVIGAVAGDPHFGHDPRS